MKSLFASSLTAIAASALFVAAASNPANAADYTWDTVSDGANITAGSGVWSTTATNWNNAGTNVAWSQTSATAATNAAIFAGTDGAHTVTLDGTINAQSVRFDNNGYILTSGTLILKPTSSTNGSITVAAGNTATIDSILSYSNSAVAAVTVGSGGTLNLGGGTLGTTNNPIFNFSGAGTINLNGGTFTNNSTSRIATFGNAEINLTSGTHAITPGTGAVISSGTQNVAYNLSGGTLSVIGSTTSSTNAHLAIGSNTGTAFTSTLNVSGSGTLVTGTTTSRAGEIQIAKTGSSNGTLNVSGGTVTVGTGTTDNKIYFFKAGANEGYTANMTQSGGTVTANGIQFGGTTGTYSGTSSANLTLNSGTLYVGLQGITRGTAAATLPFAIKLQGGTIGASDTWSSSLDMKLGATSGGPVFQAATSDGTAKTITLSGVLSDDDSVSGKLTKSGVGTLVLSGSNTFSGGVTIKNGTLESKSTEITLGSGTVTMGGAGSSGATFITGKNNSNPFVINAPDSGNIVIGANGVGSGFTLSGGVTLNGNLTLQTFENVISGSTKATAQFTGGVTGTGNLLLNNLGLAANIITISGSSVNHTGSITVSGTAATGDTTISAPIGSNVTGITQNSATSTLVLSGSNTYACNLTVNAGTVRISNNSNTANDVSTVSIASGGTLDLNYSGTDTVKKLVIAGDDQPSGVYGALGSDAPVIGIAQITGAGTLTVGAAEIEVEQPANTVIASGGSQDFGSAEVGSYTERTFTIRNSGQFDLNLTGTPSVAISGTGAEDFTVTEDPITPISPGETTTFTVRFAPSEAGDRAATLTIANNDSDEVSYVINLTGTGVQPSAPEISVQQGTNILSGGSRDFGEVLLHKASESSQSLTFTIRNTGDLDLNLTENPDLINISGTNAADFTVTSTPAAIIEPGETTTFTVKFTPSAAGARNASLSISHNDNNGNENPFIINLSGTCTTAPEIVVEQPAGTDAAQGASRDFGTVIVGSDDSRTFTIRNIGSAVLNLSGTPRVSIDTANPSEFSVTAVPTSTVAIDGSTTFTVKFAPIGASGIRSASLSIANDDSDESSFVINLTGKAILPPEIVVEQPSEAGIGSGGSKDFGTTGIGFSNSLTFTIRNTGEADLNLTGTPRVAISGTHAADFTVTAQPAATIAGASSTTFTVIFAPSGVGTRSAQLSIAHNDNSGSENPFLINLSGTSVLPPDIAVEQPAGTNVASGLLTTQDYGTVDWGSNKSLTFTIRNTGLGGLNLSGLPRVEIGGANPDDFVVTATPASYVAPGGSTTFTVQFAPRAAGERKATVTIKNNDFEDESPYVFKLKGTGVGGPKIAVEQADGTNIDNNNVDRIDFGSVMRDSSKPLTFTVRNSGTGYLYLTGTPRVKVDGDFNNFIVSSAPASSVAGGGSTSFTVQFVPSAKPDYEATLKIDNEVNGSYVINLKGTGIGDPEIAVEQAGNNIDHNGSNNFGEVLRGSSSSRTFTIRNTGNIALNLSGTPRVAISGTNASDFLVVSSPSNVVAAGGSTIFEVQFNPSGAGVRNAQLTIPNNDSDEGSYLINLRGSGIGDPEMDVEQAGNNIAHNGSQDFGKVTPGSTKSLTFTIRNTGNIGLNLTRNTGEPLVKIIGYDKDSFLVTASPATAIPADGSTNFTVQFTPSSEAPHSASLSIFNDDSTENPFVINLSGNSAAEIAVEQPVGANISNNGSQDFGSVDIGATNSLTFTIRNSGGIDMNLTGSPLVEIDGDNAADFTVTAQPEALVAATDGSTTFTVEFAPSALGARSAQLSITNDDNNESPFVINLSGNGTGASEIAVEDEDGTEIADGGSQDFGSVLLGYESDLTFTIRNSGDRPLNLTGNELVEISGTNAGDFMVTAIPDEAVEGPGSTTFSVKFVPGALGPRNASLSITNSDSNESPYVINLSGTAVDELTYGSDHAGNYPVGWTTGSNGGTGFGAWTIDSNDDGTTRFAGNFVGNPADAGITGMTSTSFGLYANPSGSGAFVNADRSFTNPLGVGESFSFLWSINYDSGATGNKGFNLYSGGIGGTELINVNNAGSSFITINKTNIGFGYGTAAMTWTITRTSETNLQVAATNRDGGTAYSGNFTISGAPDAFRFYASQMDVDYRDLRQPFFNNLQLTRHAPDVASQTLDSPADPYGDFMTSYGLTGDDALGTADPDGDGQSNDAEFAFGTDPTSGTSSQTSLVDETGAIKLVYLQRDLGVTYTVKSFTDFDTPFDEGGTVVTPVASDPQPAGLPEGYTQYEASLSTSSGKGFLRVKAVRE
jgi:autotransporter-associated beta strand protein